MSRNRCTFCGHSGHNRRSCSSLRQKIRDEPDGYYARQARSNAKLYPTNPRRCGYCKETGHNKKTCHKRKDALIEISKKARSWRTQFLECAKEVGFGLGALVKFKDPSFIENEYRRSRIEKLIQQNGDYAIVMKLQHDKLDHRQLFTPLPCMLVRFPSGKNTLFPLPLEFSDLLGKDRYGDNPMFEVVGKVKTSNFQNHFHQAWHQGVDVSLSDHLKA